MSNLDSSADTSEARFRSAFEDTSVAMVLTGMDNRFVRVNAAFARLFGYSQEEMLGLAMADITHPDDVAESYARREVLLSGAANFFQMEKRYLHKDGKVFWGLTNVSLVRGADGQPLQYVGQVQDIAERKRAEERNRRYNERLRILHQIDRALLAGEGPAEIAGAALPLVRDLLGVRRAVVNLFDLASGTVEWLAAVGRRRVRLGPGVRYSLQFMGDVAALQRGEPQWIDVHAMPAGPEVAALLASEVDSYVVVPMIADGELIGGLSFGGAAQRISGEQLGIAQEVARQFAIALTQARMKRALQAKNEELRETSQQLWQTAKLATVGELAASIAHELNNPLCTVTLRIEALLAQAAPHGPTYRELKVIEQETERMARLVANLLQFSRPGHQQVSTFEVTDEIDKTLELSSFFLRKRSVTVTRAFATGLPMIQGDRQKLRQVFLNLIVNASDAMPQGGTLTVQAFAGSLADNQPAIVLEFVDTGIGIPAENLSKIMEPFFTTKEVGKGTGLGLPICRRIVQEHHGLIDVSSEGGKGTTVRVTLPVGNGESTAHLETEECPFPVG